MIQKKKDYSTVNQWGRQEKVKVFGNSFGIGKYTS